MRTDALSAFAAAWNTTMTAVTILLVLFATARVWDATVFLKALNESLAFNL